jgi:hypothetical protein
MGSIGRVKGVHMLKNKINRLSIRVKEACCRQVRIPPHKLKLHIPHEPWHDPIPSANRDWNRVTGISSGVTQTFADLGLLRSSKRTVAVPAALSLKLGSFLRIVRRAAALTTAYAVRGQRGGLRGCSCLRNKAT